jgi:hypothetical protein
MILTGDNSQLVYKSALAAPSTVRRSSQQRHLCCSPQYWLVSCKQRHLWQLPALSDFLPSETSLERVGGGRRKWEFSLSFPVGLPRILLHSVKSYDRGPPALLPIRKGVLRIFIALKNLSPWQKSNPQPLCPVASTLTTTPPRPTKPYTHRTHPCVYERRPTTFRTIPKFI